MNEYTMADWLNRGRAIVEEGRIESVRIMGRRPGRVTDPHSPAPEYGWRYGWRWQDDSASSSCTLPEVIFNRLPDCPNPEVVRLRAEGRGIMPRWPSEGEALAALDAAAWAWAKTSVGPEGL